MYTEVEVKLSVGAKNTNERGRQEKERKGGVGVTHLLDVMYRCK